MKFIKRFKEYCSASWRRLTWIHIVSINPNQSLLKDNVWYSVTMTIKRDGIAIIVDKAAVTEVK